MVRGTITSLCGATCGFVIHLPRRFRRPPSRRTGFAMGTPRVETTSRRLSPNRNIDALWDSSATWTPFAAKLVYDGPLPKRCLCHTDHKTFKGSLPENGFISSATASLGVSFWARVLPSIADFTGPNSLWDGGFSANLEPTHRRLACVFSLATSSSSWSSFYLSWLTGDLTRLQLSEFATSGMVDGYSHDTAAIPLDSIASLTVLLSLRRLRLHPVCLHLRGSCH